MPEKIIFYNSWSKKKEEFKPTQPGVVRIYNCGPTVYKRPHIGNLRRFLFADILRRTLEINGYQVHEITNITDVGHLTQDELEAGEDKLEQEARKEKVSVQQIAQRETKNFLADRKALNIQAAQDYPCATNHIPEMIEMIQKLIDNGYAYVTKVGVFFAVDKFKAYGQLSGNTIAGLAAGKRLSVRQEKHNAADFALWLTDDPSHLQQWDAPWGRGYPGWHIECSAMSLKYLGSDIDIHTGGEDNKFPHHENEIAQAEGATGEKFVHYWMHNAHLQVNGAKLAKREGQQITLDTVREKGFSPLVLRWLVWSSHYRSKIDFTWDKMVEAKLSLDKIKTLLRRVYEGLKKDDQTGQPDMAVVDGFKEALADDLNTVMAVALVQKFVNEANSQLDEMDGDENNIQSFKLQIYATLLELDRGLGVLKGLEAEIAQEEIPAEVVQIAEAREAARKEHNFAAADDFKGKIIKAGFVIEDTSNGYRLRKA